MNVGLGGAAVIAVVLASDQAIEWWLSHRRRVRAGPRVACPRPGRLERRLDNAMMGMRPVEWRCVQALAATPLLMLLMMGGTAPFGAAVTAGGVVRAVAAAILRARRDRLAKMLERSAGALLRSIAAELCNGDGAGTAVLSAGRGRVGAERSEAARIMRTAGLRVSVGATPGAAVSAAIDEACGRVNRPVSALLAARASIVAHFAAGTGHGDALIRLADVLDAEQRSRATARAGLSEVRVAAFAVPALTSAVAATLTTADRGAQEVLAWAPGAAIIAALLIVAAGGVAVTARLTG